METYKCKKSVLEDYLFDNLDRVFLDKRKEETDIDAYGTIEYANVYLYYNEDKKHVATWSRGIATLLN